MSRLRGPLAQFTIGMDGTVSAVFQPDRPNTWEYTPNDTHIGIETLSQTAVRARRFTTDTTIDRETLARMNPDSARAIIDRTRRPAVTRDRLGWDEVYADPMSDLIMHMAGMRGTNRLRTAEAHTTIGYCTMTLVYYETVSDTDHGGAPVDVSTVYCCTCQTAMLPPIDAPAAIMEDHMRDQYTVRQEYHAWPFAEAWEALAAHVEHQHSPAAAETVRNEQAMMGLGGTVEASLRALTAELSRVPSTGPRYEHLSDLSDKMYMFTESVADADRHQWTPTPLQAPKRK